MATRANRTAKSFMLQGNPTCKSGEGRESLFHCHQNTNIHGVPKKASPTLKLHSQTYRVVTICIVGSQESTPSRCARGPGRLRLSARAPSPLAPCPTCRRASPCSGSSTPLPSALPRVTDSARLSGHRSLPKCLSPRTWCRTSLAPRRPARCTRRRPSMAATRRRRPRPLARRTAIALRR